VPDDTKFDEFLRHAAKDYNAPVTPPADAIWSAIEGDVAKAIRPAQIKPFPQRRTWILVATGIAATLMLGVAVGRWSATTPPPTTGVRGPVALSPAATASDDSTRIAAHAQAVTLAHLADAEVFLTVVRSDLKAGRSDVERAARSRDLLVRTRLLLGASPDRSPAVEQLLEDLELLLAEIAALPKSRPSMDLRLLDETMREGNVLPRIRATLPAQSVGT
jgi:hypothetical protein